MSTSRTRTLFSALALALLAVAVTSLSPGPATAAHPSRADRADSLPPSFTWSSTDPLISPKPDAAHPIVSSKDPTVFRHDNHWHVYATTANSAGVWALATRFDERRYLRARTDDNLDGSWTPLTETEANPFVPSTNVTFQAGRPVWTVDIGHGDLIRGGAEQTQTIDPCAMRFLSQEMAPASGGDNPTPLEAGTGDPDELLLLTQTDPPAHSSQEGTTT